MSLKETLVAKPADMVCDWLACCWRLPFVVLMYAQGVPVAILTLILSSAGCISLPTARLMPGAMSTRVSLGWGCSSCSAGLHHRHRLHNYSSTNQLTFERAQEVLMDRSFRAGKYNFSLFPAGDEWKLALTDGDSGKITSPMPLNSAASRNWP